MMYGKKIVGSKKRPVRIKRQNGAGSFKNKQTINRKIERVENGVTYFIGGRVS